ncbi:transcriptional regulator [Moraxella macacae 0408225]|uniref:Transcriptional regulator n=1 Tax=Moraxella macacae 0408225 TaxID=1230338 RepID=L2F6D1_9GAMM|nr:transcriptional regulator [Moraxella macacae 0408225]
MLSDGQVIAIDTSARRIFDGEIYAFRKNDEIKVKYLFKTNDGFKAISRNDDKLRYPHQQQLLTAFWRFFVVKKFLLIQIIKI